MTTDITYMPDKSVSLPRRAFRKSVLMQIRKLLIGFAVAMPIIILTAEFLRHWDAGDIQIDRRFFWLSLLMPATPVILLVLLLVAVSFKLKSRYAVLGSVLTGPIFYVVHSVIICLTGKAPLPSFNDAASAIFFMSIIPTAVMTAICLTVMVVNVVRDLLAALIARRSVIFRKKPLLLAFSMTAALVFLAGSAYTATLWSPSIAETPLEGY